MPQSHHSDPVSFLALAPRQDVGFSVEVQQQLPSEEEGLGGES